MTRRDGMGVKVGGRFERRGCIHTCSWFTSVYSRNEHNIVKQLYSNLKINNNNKTQTKQKRRREKKSEWQQPVL